MAAHLVDVGVPSRGVNPFEGDYPVRSGRLRQRRDAGCADEADNHQDSGEEKSGGGLREVAPDVLEIQHARRAFASEQADTVRQRAPISNALI